MTDEYELGQIVRLGFPSRARDTSELTTLFQSAAGGTPTFELRKRSNHAVVTNNPPTVNLNTPVNGRHAMVWDTSNSSDAAEGEDYDLHVLDGRVSADGTTDNWVSANGDVPVSFSIINRTAGFVLSRTIKTAAFTVQSVTDAANFEISGAHIVQTPNFYNLLNIVFDPGAQNFSRGGVVRNSGAGTGANTAIELMEPLPVFPQPGDTGTFLPEERPREQYWADIRGEFAPTDNYSAEWFNGSVSTAPDGTNIPLITIRRISDASMIATAQPMLPVLGSNVWKYESTNELLSANDKAHVTVTSTINGQTRTFSRTLVHAV